MHSFTSEERDASPASAGGGATGRRPRFRYGAEKLTEVAEPTLPAFGTDALKGGDAVDAGASVSTGPAGAVVNICKSQRGEDALRSFRAKTRGRRGAASRRGLRPKAARTFVTVGAAEAGVTRAGEVAAGLADAASPRAADVGRDAAHPGRVVGRHGNGAAVDGCEKTRSDRSAKTEDRGGGGGYLGRGHSGSSL